MVPQYGLIGPYFWGAGNGPGPLRFAWFQGGFVRWPCRHDTQWHLEKAGLLAKNTCLKMKYTPEDWHGTWEYTPGQGESSSKPSCSMLIFGGVFKQKKGGPPLNSNKKKWFKVGTIFFKFSMQWSISVRHVFNKHPQIHHKTHGNLKLFVFLA